MHEGMRMVFIWIFVLGIIGSAVTHLPSRRSPSTNEIFANAAATVEEASTSESAARAPSSDGALDIPRSDNGHFYADVDVNGTKLHMLIDTGATGIALSRQDARSAGIATSIGMNDVVGEGADGSVHGEVVMVDRLSLGSVKAEAMPAIVLNSGGQSLLGQEFLAKFASVEIHGDTMTLK
jgi:aspartyl protease family protein